MIPGLNNGLMQPGRGALGLPPMRLAAGGQPDPMQPSPLMTGQPGAVAAGLINSTVPGRTDQLGTEVPEGTYVIPADVVSGLGQGNTMSGGALFDKMFREGPYKHAAHGLAAGGIAEPPRKKVKVVVAGGEYFVPPQWVESIGRHEMSARKTNSPHPAATLQAGHDALDRMVLKIRNQVKNRLGKLPGPKR